MAVLLLLAFGGCATTPSVGIWTGPEKPAAVVIKPWPNRENGREYQTEHYVIYTTIDDDDLMNKAARVMEGAMSEYRTLAPDVVPNTVPMECFIFANRPEWAAFTTQIAGKDASVYLQINRGGYTVGDRYVAYNIGPTSTLSVAAHEGWHQFVGRYFKGRLPPFLEEGLATMFETIRWDGDRPQWNLSINQARVISLRSTIEKRALWPLDQLVTLHAGNVVFQSGERIEAFYCQDWAFAEFLWNADSEKYRPVLRKILDDTYNGTPHDPTGALRRSYLGFNPAGVRPLLEYYFGMSLPDIDQRYQAYIRKLGFDDLSSQYGL